MAIKSVLEIAHRRELHVLGGHWPDVVAVDVGTVSELFAKVDRALLVSLDAGTDQAASFDIMVSETVIGLWLGDQRLAMVER